MAGKRKAAGATTSRTADMSWPELLRARLGRSPKKGKVAKQDRPPKTWKSRLKRFFLWSTVAGLVLALVAVGGFIYLYRTTDIPEPNAEFLTNASIVYYDDGKTEVGRYALQNRESISFDDMPEVMKQAVVAAEDETFYSNNGIDTKGIVRAVFNNASGGSTQGASTITQQYVKILYLNQERSYKRKVKEAILSLKIQREQSKDQVLAGYLNTIYFGRGAYGIQAAANAYFDKPAKELGLREAAVLASVLNDPNDLDPADGIDTRRRLKGRFQYVLDRMAKAGDITQADAETAKKQLPKFPKIKAQSAYGGQRGHMLTLIKDQLLDLDKKDGSPFTEDEIDGGGLRITTTLQPKIMKAVQAGIEEVKPTERTDQFKSPSQLHAAAATVEPGTGALRGFYAGQDYLKSQINWAIAGGQAGSTFKPYALAAGLKDGYSLKDTFDGNSPIDVGGTEFENQGEGGSGDYGPAVSLLEATEKSINTAYIDLTDSMNDGPKKIIRMAQAMGVPGSKASKTKPFGIPTTSGELNPETGVALGSATVSPINMANGYATIANEGVAAQVYVIKKVEDRDGEVLYEHKVTDKRALNADIASDVSYALQQTADVGSGMSAKLDDDRPIAGKTGTATKTGGAVSSSWFVGFTPQLSTAVMYVRGPGNGQLDGWLPATDDGKLGYFGGNYPAKTWKAIMTRELDGVEVEDFPEPANVDGDAPDDGHAPYVPPQTSLPSEPQTSETQEPTAESPTTPPPTSAPATTQPPTSTAPTPPETTDPCGLLGCPTSDPPTSAPPTSPAPSNPTAPAANPRATYRRER
ncbi:transglycosylase domain-containing protein [Nocardioides plantarum]|uniref:Transglycosylase domain-containing protein n=1 Tax=Nocardioides plantarum TaxID=29299 RepID=A0ABV5KI71_9ACTN|nr:transglycosylase domain-containing protein [Nocardioides plantarum]